MLQVINRPIYFKTVEEAFVFANPHLHKLLLPNLTAQKVTPQKVLTELTAIAEKNKSGAGKQPAELIKELTEKLVNYVKKGAIGDVLFRQALKKDNNKLTEQLKSVGITI